MIPIGRPKKRAINIVEEIPLSCPVPVKTYIRKKAVVDPLACTPNDGEGKGYETVNGNRASGADLSNQEFTQDMDLEGQYVRRIIHLKLNFF